MKKIFLILFFALFMCMSINAQQWTVVNNSGDELRGTTASTSYMWTEYNGTFYYQDNDDKLFIINTSEGIFNSNGQRGTKGRPIVVGLVGFYNEDDSMIEKMELTFEINEGSQSVYPNKYTYKGGNNYKRSKHVLDFIQNNKGYVRILIPRYNKTDLELKVQCNKE